MPKNVYKPSNNQLRQTCRIREYRPCNPEAGTESPYSLDFFPDKVLIVPAIDQEVYMSRIITMKEPSSLGSGAKEEIGRFREQSIGFPASALRR